jgi:hypothetical protein
MLSFFTPSEMFASGDQFLMSAFLSEFSPFHDYYTLLPLDTSNISPHSLESVLSAIANGSLEPYYDADDDDPKWTEAMASLEHEFCIASAYNELKSLKELQVFVLVP